MEVHYDQFHHMIAPSVGMCPAPIINKELRRAATRFCEETRVWRHSATQTLAANDEAIDVPSFATIHQIASVKYGGKALVPLAMHDWPDTPTEGTPCAYGQFETGTLRIDPFTAGDYAIVAYLKPRGGQDIGGEGTLPAYSDAFDRLPAFMLTDYGNVLADGAIGRILAIPEQEWTNPQLAAYHMGEFERALSDTVLKHQVRAPTRTVTRWF